jgi:hypothetical protein
MAKPRRKLPATELRVHLGEALKALEEEDLVIEKGGVPVAILSRYDGIVYRVGKGGTEMSTGTTAYLAALSKRGNPAAWPAAFNAMKRGWAGIESGEMTGAVYAAREAGASTRAYTIDEEDASDDEVPGRQRYLHRGSREARRVADEGDGGYTA